MYKKGKKKKMKAKGFLFCILVLIGATAVMADEPVMEWAVTYNGEGNTNDGAYAMQMDGEENLYLFGNTGSYACVVKYNSNGELLWDTVYEEYQASFKTSDYAVPVTSKRLAIDSSGNPVVVFDDEDNLRVRVIKFDAANGGILWNCLIDSSEVDAFDMALETDNYGYTYVTYQMSPAPPPYDSLSGRVVATIKFDYDGIVVWKALSPYGYMAGDLAIDNDGDVYTSGLERFHPGALMYDMQSVKFGGTDGSLIWDELYTWPVQLIVDHALRNMLDSSGDLYVTGFGRYYYGQARHLSIIKYDTDDGSELWATRVIDELWDVPLDMEVLESAGKVVVAGYQCPQYCSIDDIFLLLFDSETGEQEWLVSIGELDYDDKLFSVDLDADENIYVAGYYGSDGHADAYTAK